MKIEDAKKLNKLLKHLETLEADLKEINNTREFTTVTFSGEDGAEKPHIFNIGWWRNSNDKIRYVIAKKIHRTAYLLIEEEIANTKLEIENI